jgi:hypothetical protein
MRNFDSGYAAEIAKEIAAVFWLVSLQMGSATQRYTDADIPLVYNSNVYAPLPLAVTDIQQSPGFQVDSVTVELDNTSRLMSATLLGEDAVGRGVVLRRQALNASRVAIATVEIFSGYILGWPVLDESRAQLKIGNEFAFWNKKALRLPTPSCPWSFKGPECGYAGAAAKCDQSPERCANIGNYVNFGGRKFIADVESQKIYWGFAEKAR